MHLAPSCPGDLHQLTFRAAGPRTFSPSADSGAFRRRRCLAGRDFNVIPSTCGRYGRPGRPLHVGLNITKPLNHRLIQQFAMEIRDLPSERVTCSVTEEMDLKCMAGNLGYTSADFNFWAAQFQQQQPMAHTFKSEEPQRCGKWIPSGALTFCHGKSPCYKWEHPRFLWPLSIAFCMFTRG